MYFKKSFLAMVFTLLSFNCVTYAATDAVTELAIQEKTARMLNQSDEGLEVIIMQDGTEYVDLKGRYQMISKVKIVDGKQVFVCDGNPGIEHKGHTHTAEETKPNLERAVK